MHAIFILTIILLIVSIVILCLPNKKNEENEEFQNPTMSPKDKDNTEKISKEELRNQVTILFKKLEEETKRHDSDLNKIYEGLKTALSLSLAPNKTLPEKPQRKIAELCKFSLKGPAFKKAKELYNKHKTNSNFEMIQLYQTPIGRQSKDFKNKVKTYGYTYYDNTPKPDEPFYKQEFKKEYYGNITLKFDDKCNVIDFVSIDANIYKKISKETDYGDNEDE